MKEYLPVLEKSNLFSGINAEEISSMLNCLSAHVCHYHKQEFILHSGALIHKVGLLLAGHALIIQEDFWGNRTIISEVLPGSLFAETYACLSSVPVEVSVISDSECDVVFLDFNKILTVCSSACTYHTRLIQNFLSAIAVRNLSLTRKMEHMSKKTIREKLLSYLSAESLKNNSSAFAIPFNRQQLADYLSVDRSALSSELGRLKAHGILTYKKNHFVLKETIPK